MLQFLIYSAFPPPLGAADENKWAFLPLFGVGVLHTDFETGVLTPGVFNFRTNFFLFEATGRFASGPKTFDRKSGTHCIWGVSSYDSFLQKKKKKQSQDLLQVRLDAVTSAGLNLIFHLKKYGAASRRSK